MEERKRVLVADDSILNRRTLCAALPKSYEMIEVPDGNSALTLLRQQGNIDAVLLDVSMPGKSGLEVLAEMQSDPALREIPVIIVTAAQETEVEVQALTLGATDFLTKPFEPAVVERRVKNAVDKRELEMLRVANRVMQELRAQEQIDRLTGIYTREAFYRYTQTMLQENLDTPFVLLRWNIERFQLINELYGTEMGDEILRQMAGVCKTLLGPDRGLCSYGRLEADHFGVCMPRKMLDIEDVVRRAEIFYSQLLEDFKIKFCIGVYEVDNPFLPVDQMCDRANLAMRSVKGNYHLHYAYYDDNIRQAMLLEQEITSDMYEALSNHEFAVYLQPVWGLSEDKPVSAEALVRWQHPTKGLISPGKFIPVFEKNGFIAELDEYVWREVCCYLQSRRERQLPDIPISVNASRRSLNNPHLCELILELTQSHGIDPWLFKIEITETAYTANPERLIRTIEQLQEHGFPVMMDDFGSGYSSFNTLKDIPVDILKIDMKFLEGFETGGRVGTILTSILRMTKWLNLPTVAEGVETLEQAEFLRSIGTDYIQGFHYSKPLPVAAFEVFLAHPNVEQKRMDAVNIVDESEIEMLMGGNHLFNQLLGSVFGAIAFYEYAVGRLEQIRVNNGYYEIMRETPSTVATKSADLLQSVSESDRKAYLHAIETAIRTAEPQRLKIRRHCNDGTLIWLDSLITHMGVSSRYPLLCIAFSDITEATNASEQLTNIMENVFAGILLYRTGGAAKLLFANRQYYEMCGYTKEQYAQEVVDPFALVHPNDIASVQYCLEGARISRKPFTQEYRQIKRDGSSIWVRCRSKYLQEQAGDTADLLIVMSDITAEVEAMRERELHPYSQALFHIFDEVLACDLHNKTVTVLQSPRGALQQLGEVLTMEEAMQVGLDECRLPSDRVRLQSFVDKAKEEPEEAWTTEYSVCTNGKIRWLFVTALKLEKDSYLLCDMDITAQKEKEIAGALTL